MWPFKGKMITFDLGLKARRNSSLIEVLRQEITLLKWVIPFARNLCKDIKEGIFHLGLLAIALLAYPILHWH